MYKIHIVFLIIVLALFPTACAGNVVAQNNKIEPASIPVKVEPTEIPETPTLEVVSKDSPADRAGLKPGDIILTAGGREIRENIDLPILIASTPIGGAAVLGIYRNGREYTVKVIVGSMPG